MIEIAFLRRDRTFQTCKFPLADRDAPHKLLKLLNSFDARLPDETSAARRFVEALVRSIPAASVTATSCPGWRDHARGFVMPCRMYGTAVGRFVWDGSAGSREFGAICGTLAEYQRGVLKPALQSTHLTVAILLELAAPLVGYVEGRLRRHLMAETALFHWAGDTSTGKTTLARAAQSVIGNPRSFADYRASERRIAEEAFHHNDLVAVFDETEHLDERPALYAKMKMISQCLTSGRSKQITNGLQGSLPDLRWTCFGISTGPLTQAAVAGGLNKPRHGQTARFIDILVPSANAGGIMDHFASQRLSADMPADLIKQIDDCTVENHGVLFDAWVEHLLTVDVADQVERILSGFAKELSGGEGGLAGRLAPKLALFYAAADVAIDAGLLPWPKQWCRYAVEQTYRNALVVRDPTIWQLSRVVLEVDRAVRDQGFFPRVRAKLRGVPDIALTQTALGFIVEGGQSAGGYLIPNRLRRIGAMDANMQRRVADAICDQALGPTSGGRLFRSFKFGHECKFRAWRFTPASLDAAVQTAKATLNNG